MQLGVNPTSPQDMAQPQAQPQTGSLMSNTFKPGRWSQEEHERFLKGFELYGHKWRKVRDVVGTRTVTQVRTHAQKFFVKMKKQSTMEKPTITTPHKNSPRHIDLRPSVRKEVATSQTVGGAEGTSSWGQVPHYDFVAAHQPAKLDDSIFASLLAAAERLEAGGSSS